MFIYKIDVLKVLREKGYNTNKIRKDKLLSEKTLQDFRNGRIVGINVLDKLCALLDCQPNYIIKHVTDEELDKLANDQE